ncbi:MAG: orotidine 5'-phosphate decarboxylase [Geoglossum umbratile]|nr:MAG: orotidine 5'-phosphate decarboxylase [Geoglossum umbratile]
MAATTPHPTLSQPYEVRANAQAHPLARYLLQLMALKETNLCVSADVRTAAALLALAEQVGDSICVLKTHCDMIEDWNDETALSMREVALRKGFCIFEDRKFGDIGSTVQKQYTSGPFKIVRWANLTNAHIFPGPSIITALKAAAAQHLESHNRCVVTEITAAGRTSSPAGGEDSGDEDEEEEDGRDDEGVGGEAEEDYPRARKRSIISTTVISTTTELLDPHRGTPSFPPATFLHTPPPPFLQLLGPPPLERALLLLAQMSSEGNLMDKPYTAKCVELARQERGFVVGFISQGSLNTAATDDFLVFTPGVGLPPPEHDEPAPQARKTDGLGQNYRTPRHVVLECGADIVIVGRGILDAADRAGEAERYRKQAWGAYEERVGKRIEGEGDRDRGVGGGLGIFGGEPKGA